jgi:hypothetical protein
MITIILLKAAFRAAVSSSYRLVSRSEDDSQRRSEQSERSLSSEARPLTAAAAEATARLRSPPAPNTQDFALVMMSRLVQECCRVSIVPLRVRETPPANRFRLTAGCKDSGGAVCFKLEQTPKYLLQVGQRVAATISWTTDNGGA